MKPKIFVSSTIIDFEDLRGALKYYLEEWGYDVQMSEYPNFTVDSSSSAIDTCIKNLEDCQYYILLIGYRRGSWYTENKLSVTNLEYQAAKKLIEKNHPLRILTFVRKPIWLLRNDREGLIKHFTTKSEEYSKVIKETGSTIIDDPAYIFNFLKEISAGIKFPGNHSPTNDWITEFNQFEDIIVALKNTFHISESLQERRLKKLLKDELISNKTKFLNTINGKNVKERFGPLKFTQEHVFKYLAETYDSKLFDMNDKPLFIDGIQIEQVEADRLTLFYSIFIPMMGIKSLKTRFLEKAIYEGLFLDYDINIDNFDTNQITFSLEKLLEWIDNFKGIFTSKFYDVFKKEMTKIITDRSLNKPSINISAESSTFLMQILQGNEIFNLIEAILTFLNNNDIEPLKNFDFKS